MLLTNSKLLFMPYAAACLCRCRPERMAGPRAVRRPAGEAWGAAEGAAGAGAGAVAGPAAGAAAGGAAGAAGVVGAECLESAC